MSKNPTFDIYAKYYDLLYQDKEYDKEVNYLVGLINEYMPKANSILEFGSGTGIHGLLFKAKGYSVFGIELSQKMVDEARSKGFETLNADISNFAIEKTFDVVISLFHVISYIIENDTLIKVFQNAYTHLNSGGVFIFDVWYSPAVFTQKASVKIKKMDNEELSITRIAEPVSDVNKNRVDVHFTLFAREYSTDIITEFKEVHSMRHFSVPEIEFLAKITGFDVIGAKEFMTHNHPSENTWGVCFILKKKD